MPAPPTAWGPSAHDMSHAWVETRPPTCPLPDTASLPVMHDGGVSMLSGPVPVSETVSVWNLP